MKRIGKKIVLLLFISLLFSSCLSRDVHEINRARSELIISALYDYKMNNGHFPKDLDELVPNYMESIPSPIKGSEFYYTSNSVHGFRLSYTVSPKFGCGFSDRLQSWECGWGAE